MAKTKVTRFTEVRTLTGFYFTPKNHFFYDGKVFVKGTGSGNFAGESGSGAVKGVIKIALLHNGRYSVRSVGLKGNGLTIHVSGNTKIVVDTHVTTIEDFYQAHA